MPVVSSPTTIHPSVPSIPNSTSSMTAHSKYHYLVIPFLGSLQRGVFSSQGADVVSQQLQSLINQHNSQGWEYYHIATVYVAVSTGCLADLLGIKSGSIQINQVMFRRPV